MWNLKAAVSVGNLEGEGWEKSRFQVMLGGEGAQILLVAQGGKSALRPPLTPHSMPQAEIRSWMGFLPVLSYNFKISSKFLPLDPDFKSKMMRKEK